MCSLQSVAEVYSRDMFKTLARTIQTIRAICKRELRELTLNHKFGGAEKRDGREKITYIVR